MGIPFPVLSLLRVDEHTNHPVSTPSSLSIGLLVVRTIKFEKIPLGAVLS